MSVCEALSSLTKGVGGAPRLLVVLAHPDDEVLAVGGRLERLMESRFVCLTDGVPLDGKDALHHGFAGLDDYRMARRHELQAAFELAGLNRETCARDVALAGRTERYVSDQTAAFWLTNLTRSLASEIRSFQPEAILTHPYEGGHPDHDACAFAVHGAVRLLGGSVPLVEAPFYHATLQGLETGTFLPGGPAISIDELSPEEQQRKRERLACFVSQRETLGSFGTEREVYRPAPAYNFTLPPHDGALYYEGFPWGMSGGHFCALAANALQELGLRD